MSSVSFTALKYRLRALLELLKLTRGVLAYNVIRIMIHVGSTCSSGSELRTLIKSLDNLDILAYDAQ